MKSARLEASESHHSIENELDFYNNSIDFDVDFDYDYEEGTNGGGVVGGGGNSETNGTDNENAVHEKCKCCLHLPAPPSVSAAKLDLIKQLKIYLELIAMYPTNDHLSKDSEYPHANSITTTNTNNTNTSVTLKPEDINSLRLNDESFISTLNNESILSNDVRMKRTEMDNSLCSKVDLDDEQAYIDYDANDEEEKSDEAQLALLKNSANSKSVLINKNSTGDMNNASGYLKSSEKLRPLIPLHAYFDDTSENNLSASITTSSSSLCATKLVNEAYIGREWLFKEIDKVILFCATNCYFK